MPAMRILLIEDDRMIGSGLSAALTREGLSVDWARTGPRARRRWPTAATGSSFLISGCRGARGSICSEPRAGPATAPRSSSSRRATASPSGSRASTPARMTIS